MSRYNEARALADALHLPMQGSSLPKDFDLEELYKRGVIRKKDLEDGAYYLGLCRNSSIAMWNTGKQKFTYMRTKFTMKFPEDINHPEDDDGYDLFTPLAKIPNPEEQYIIKYR